MSLTERQEIILQGVCKEFIKSAQPISSQFLKEEQNLNFSSATIRSEFGELEKRNYLSHPYISSGRIPTDKGYRFLVDKILENKNFQFKSKKKIEEIKNELQKLRDILEISHQITKILSTLSSNLVLTYLFNENLLWKEGWEMVVKKPEFQDIDYWKKFIEMTCDFEDNICNFNCREGEIKIYIGRESPLRSKDFSLIVGGTSFPKKDYNPQTGRSALASRPTTRHGLIALLGPKRMDFEKSISLVSGIAEILERG